MRINSYILGRLYYLAFDNNKVYYRNEVNIKTKNKPKVKLFSNENSLNCESRNISWLRAVFT